MSEHSESHPDSDSQEIFARLQAQHSTPPVDPTANVLSLVAAAMRRQDDLRNTDDRWAERLRKIEERCATELDELREKLREAESTRIDALNLAESRRLDAVNAENKGAISLSSERATTTAATLAATVATTATTMAAQTNALRDSLEKRLALVEQNQYQTGGRDIQKGESSNALRDNVGLIVGALGLMAAVAMGLLR